jgi:hypothetical protein
MSSSYALLQQQQAAILAQQHALFQQQSGAEDITNVNPASRDDIMTAAGDDPDALDQDHDLDLDMTSTTTAGGERRRFFSKELRCLGRYSPNSYQDFIRISISVSTTR